MTDKLSFSIEKFDALEEDPNSQFATAKIQAFASGENRHSMICSVDVLKETAPSIYNKPILYNINKMYGDFGTHEKPEDTLIAGFVVPDSAEFSELSDGRMGLNIIVKLWKRYAPKFFDIIRREPFKKTSVEMDLFEKEPLSNGLYDMKRFEYTGICVLGDLITEASPGSNLQMVSFAKEKEDFEDAYRKEFSREYGEIDLAIPEEVKSNAQKGLDLYKKHNRGGSAINLSIARFILKNPKATPEKIRQIHKNFKNKKFNELKNKESDDFISWNLLGGKEGMQWAEQISQSLDEIDSKQLSYFGEIVTMPYKDIKDANPALKGIDPPITVGQANEIASQAEAIGSDEKKNGWAIAISNFKQTHKVENGHWVKKEKMSDPNQIKEDMSMEEDEKKEEMAEELTSEEKAEVYKKMAAEDKETKAEEKQETSEEEKKEEEKGEEKKMSLDAYLDVKAVLAMLDNETESYKKMAAETEKPAEEMNYGVMMQSMYAKMCDMKTMSDQMSADMEKMAEQNKAYMAENEELKKFKSDMEMNQYTMAVEATIKEIEMNENVKMPKEEYDQIREDSKNFTLETIDAWKNSAKAKAFSFSTTKKVDDGIVRMANPWGVKDNSNGSVWNRLGK